MNWFRPWLAQTDNNHHRHHHQINNDESVDEKCLDYIQMDCRSNTSANDNDNVNELSKQFQTAAPGELTNQTDNYYAYYYNYYYNQLLMQNYYSLFGNEEKSNNPKIDHKNPITINTIDQLKFHALNPNSNEDSAEQLEKAFVTLTKEFTNKTFNNKPKSDIQSLLMGKEFCSKIKNVKSNSTDEPRPKKFICIECQNGFSNRSQLNSHIRTHTGNCLLFNLIKI